ncbi:MAG: O-antigen ligase family protein [Pseudolabrys sp.]
MTLDRNRFARVADGLAVALAASLPWSTSATGILAVLWLLAIIPTLEFSSLRRFITIPAGGLPLLLVALGALGMLWADVSWAERFDGVTSFFKLLFIPLLLHRFYRSERGRHVLIGFLASCVLLLLVSGLLLAWPQLAWRGGSAAPGVPVKDYIAQSAMFTVCVLVILRFAYDTWRDASRGLALALCALALIFLANIFYVATSRTALVVIPILLLLLGYRLFGWKGAAGLVVGCFVLAMAAWPSSSFLRLRVDSFFSEVGSYRPGGNATSAGERLEFWRKSIGFIKDAPLIGHGTGSIRDQFRRSAVGQTGMAGEAAANPHNQIFGVGIQLGLVGIAVLLAMWCAHLMLFRSASFAAWVGLVVVIQNIVSSLFNSHLFDFTHGWAYVVGVGIAGGVVLKESVPRR